MHMQKIVTLCLLLLCASTTVAATQAVLPVTLAKGIPVVQLRLDGKTVPFVLDTGAGTSLHLTPEVAQSLTGLAYTGKQQKSIDLAGKTQLSDEFLVPVLDVNGLPFAALQGVILTPWGLSLGTQKGLPANMSVLGLRFFEGKQVVFDLPAGTLQISAGDAGPPLAGWMAVPYERIDEGLLLHLADGKKTYRLVLDTAASISIIRSSAAVAFSQVTQCAFDLGPDLPCRSITLALPGGKSVSPLLMPLPDEFQADGILGTDFFMQMPVLFDLQHQLLYLRPSAPAG